MKFLNIVTDQKHRYFMVYLESTKSDSGYHFTLMIQSISIIICDINNENKAILSYGNPINY